MDETLASRLIAARRCLNLTQDAFSANTGVPLSTLKKYEGAHSVPGTDALCMIAKTGINVHWLITGVGDMLMPTAAPATAKAGPAATQINEDALIAAFVGMMQVAAPGETPKQTATKAIQFYKYLLDQEMITPDGIGKGRMGNAA